LSRPMGGLMREALGMSESLFGIEIMNV
jgi:hypothetical protein